jgi:hypothetical protein
MLRSLQLSRVLLTLLAFGVFTGAAMAADPGLLYPPDSQISDQKAGSILVYNLYTSSSTLPGGDSRLAITNTNSAQEAAFVHLFFIQGSNCNVADRFTCLTGQQTLAFLASEMDPGVTGFVVAIAVDGVLGCPVNFNFLVGDVFVKFASGLHGNLGAEAITAIGDPGLGCDANAVTTVLRFDGISYNLLPRVLAVSNFPAIDDGYTSRIWINRIGGNLLTSNSSVGSITGLLFNDAENGLSWSVTGGCQLSLEISPADIRTTPPVNLHVPANTSGWLKLANFTSDVALLGCIITAHPNLATARNAFTGGRNLHKLTLSAAAVYTMPIFPPTC